MIGNQYTNVTFFEWAFQRSFYIDEFFMEKGKVCDPFSTVFEGKVWKNLGNDFGLFSVFFSDSTFFQEGNFLLKMEGLRYKESKIMSPNQWKITIKTLNTFINQDV